MLGQGCQHIHCSVVAWRLIYSFGQEGDVNICFLGRPPGNVGKIALTLY